jgi:hypothetical protein
MNNGCKRSVPLKRNGKLSRKQSPNNPQNLQADIDALCAAPLEFRRRLCAWIRANVSPSSKTHGNHAGQLKHHFSGDTRTYTTDGVFVAALLIEGFAPVNPRKPYWYFRVKIKEQTDKWPSDEFAACWPQKECADAA